MVGPPFSNNCWGLPVNKSFDSCEAKEMARLTKTSNIDATLKYKMLGASQNPITTLLSTKKMLGVPKEGTGAPYSNNCWELPKTSNIDTTLKYKMLGATKRNDRGFLNSNNNTPLKYKITFLQFHQREREKSAAVAMLAKACLMMRHLKTRVTIGRQSCVLFRAQPPLHLQS